MFALKGKNTLREWPAGRIRHGRTSLSPSLCRTCDLWCALSRTKKHENHSSWKGMLVTKTESAGIKLRVFLKKSKSGKVKCHARQRPNMKRLLTSSAGEYRLKGKSRLQHVRPSVVHSHFHNSSQQHSLSEFPRYAASTPVSWGCCLGGVPLGVSGTAANTHRMWCKDTRGGLLKLPV